MAASHVQTVDGQASTVSTSFSATINGVTAGNTLVVITGCDFASGSPVINVPTSSGLSFANALPETPVNPPVTHCRFRVDYVQNVSAGNKTIQANVASSGDDITLIVVEVAGVLTSGVLGLTNTANGGSTAVSSQVTGSVTPTAGSLLLAVIADDGGALTADTISGGFTVSTDATSWNGNHQRAGAAYLNNAPATATNPTWSIPSGPSRAVAAIVEFKASGGGPVTYPLSGTIAQAQTLGLPKQPRLSRSLSEAQSLSLVKQTALVRSLAQAQSLSLPKQPRLVRALAQAQSASIIAQKVFLRVVSTTQAQTVALLKQAQPVRAIAQTQLLGFVRQIRLGRSLTQAQQATVTLPSNVYHLSGSCSVHQVCSIGTTRVTIFQLLWAMATREFVTSGGPQVYWGTRQFTLSGTGARPVQWTGPGGQFQEQ